MKKTIMLFVLVFIVTIQLSAAMTCKRELLNPNNIVFYEGSKKIARFVWVCGGDYRKEGLEINGRVKQFDSIHGPVYDSTYTMLQYKNSRIVDGKYTEYYMPEKDWTKSSGSKPVPAGTFHIKNDQINGELKYYYRSGKILFRGTYKKGNPVGAIKRYYESGVLYSSETYTDGYGSGEVKYYRSNGKLEKINAIKECKKAGTVYYDVNGKKLNYLLRTVLAALLPGLIFLISLYPAVLAIIRLFRQPKQSVEIITNDSAEIAKIVPDRKRKKAWIFLSLLFSLPVWLALGVFTALNVHNFAAGTPLIINWTNLPFVIFGIFVNVLFAWSFLTSLEGDETVEVHEGVMTITRTWAGFKRHRKIPVSLILKIHPVIIEKESGEQYYGTARVQKNDSDTDYLSYMNVLLHNDEIITFAKYVGKPETEKFMEFLDHKIHGVTGISS